LREFMDNWWVYIVEKKTGLYVESPPIWKTE